MIPTALELANVIRAFSDEGYSGFMGFPQKHSLVSYSWSKVATKLLSQTIPVSIGQEAALSGFFASMSGLNEKSNGILMLQGAFQAYATQIALGMTISGFVGTPPPLQPDILGISQTNTDDAESYANKLANVLITWAKTGTATPVSGGSPITWN
jgi:hypothetical protein